VSSVTCVSEWMNK